VSDALKIEKVKCNSLEVDPKNARKHSERNINVIASSLESFGQRRPLVIWGNTVIAGNGTLEAAKGLGWTDVFITRVPSDWTEDQARAYALADNRSSELGDWDSELLASQLIALADTGFEIEDIGFSMDLDNDNYDPSSFLNDIDPGVPSTDSDFGEKDKYSLPYGFDSDQREVIIAAINHAKKLYSIEAPEAMTHVAKCYLESPQ
jgi:hypothetical protein